MSFKSLFVLISSLAFISLYASGQEVENPKTASIIELMAERGQENFDYSGLEEQLNEYSRHPLDINSATLEEIKTFVFLSPIQVNNFFKYRNENGRFLALQELQAIEGFDSLSIAAMLPFITLSPSAVAGHSLSDLISYGSHDLLVTFGQALEKSKGYLVSDTSSQSHYRGTMPHILTRYRYQSLSGVSAGFTAEKDAGEKALFGSGGKGFDFYSGNISFKGNGTITKLILGDYSLQIGQGLAMWSGLSFGMGPSIMSVARQGTTLRPYSSSNESSFLRGAAATLTFSSLSITPFFSLRKLDATVSTDKDSTADSGISSLSESGLHRTASEIRNHNSASQCVYGANAEYSSTSFNAGAVVCQTAFSKTILPGKSLYEKFQFNGTSLLNTSAYCSYNWQNVYFFSEIAHTGGRGLAGVTGAMAALSKQVSVALLYRDYQRDYYSFFCQGVAESGNGTAEKGMYMGLVISPDSKTEFSAYTDFYRFPWLRYRTDAPSEGYEGFCQLSYTLNKKTKFYLRYRMKKYEENDDLNEPVHFLQEVTKQNMRVEISYRLGPCQLRNRAELVLYSKGNVKEHGILVYQDVIYKPVRSRFKGSLRFAVFDSDGFDSRIYAFENDLLYTYSIPAYQNKGMRFYINSTFRISNKMDISGRYAISSYFNLDSIGSGLDEIYGHRKSDFKVQIRYRF